MNKCQITLCNRLSLRYTQTNHKTSDKLKIRDLTFDIRFNSLDQKKGKNVYSIKVDEYGWRKGYIIAINLAFVANTCAENKISISDAQMKEYENILSNTLLKNMDEFIDFPLLPRHVKQEILDKYSK